MRAKEIKGLFLRKKKSGFAIISQRVGSSVLVRRIPLKKDAALPVKRVEESIFCHPRLSPAELLLEG